MFKGNIGPVIRGLLAAVNGSWPQSRQFDFSGQMMMVAILNRHRPPISQRFSAGVLSRHETTAASDGGRHNHCGGDLVVAAPSGSSSPGWKNDLLDGPVTKLVGDAPVGAAPSGSGPPGWRNCLQCCLTQQQGSQCSSPHHWRTPPTYLPCSQSGPTEHWRKPSRVGYECRSCRTFAHSPFHTSVA